MRDIQQTFFKKKCFFTFLVSFTLLLVLFYFNKIEKMELVSNSLDFTSVPISFSLDNHFQSSDFQVHIEVDSSYIQQDIEIHYTIDGSEPTIDSPVYSEPLFFHVTDNLETHIVKAAVAYYGTISSPVTQTYFCSTEIDNRFDLPVIAITVNPDDLYNEKTGIFPNYTMRGPEWTKSAHVEVISPDGVCLVNQNMGLAVSGQTSSTYTYKPLKLDPGAEWDKENKIINLLNPYTADDIQFSPDYQNLSKLTSLRLKNGGSTDYYYSLIRENVCVRLAKDIGLTPVTSMYPAVIFLNGKYYDVMQMSATYSAANLADIYGVNKEDIMVSKGDESDVISMLSGKDYLLTADYNDTQIIADFEATFDKDNFFKYYALGLLTGNLDWPHNNVAAWRYTAPSNQSNIYTDGRIRFLYFDGSYTYRLSTEREVFDDLFDSPKDSKALLSKVLQNPEYHRYFVNIMCDLIATSFSNEHLLSVIDEESSYLDTETNYLANADIEELSNTFSNRNKAVASFKDKAAERIWFVWSGMSTYLQADYFNEEARYTLSINTPPDGMSIYCNSLNFSHAEANFEGTYFKDYPALIQASVHEGYEFDYWLVNGEKILDSSFFILPDMIRNHSVQIKAFCHQTTGVSPIISEISYVGSNDWIELINPYENNIYIGNLFLSDDPDNLKKYALPKINLSSEECLVIYGKSYAELGAYYMNISLKKGETIYLSNNNNEILQTIYLYPTLEGSSYGRYQEGNSWVFYQNPSKGFSQ